MAINKSQARDLLNKGLISQATYDKVPEDAFKTTEFNKELASTPRTTSATNATPVVESPTPILMDSTPPTAMSPTPTSTMDSSPTPALPSPIVEQTPTPSTKQVVTEESQTISSTQKKATEAANKAQKSLENAIEAERAAAAESIEVGRQKAQEAFGLNQEEQRIRTESAAKAQEIRNQGQAEMESRLANIDKQVAEVQNRKYEGYWESKDTGSKILGAISLALGAFGASRTGGPNYAMNIINKSMDMDFAAYQDATNNKIAAIKESRLSAQDKQKLIDNQLDGLAAKQLSDIAVVQNKINNLGNKFADPAAQAKLAELNAQLDQKAANARLRFEEGLAETVNTQIDRKLSTMKVDAQGNVVTPSAEAGFTSQGKPMTAEQAKAQGNLSVMNNAAEDLDRYANNPRVDLERVAQVAGTMNTLGAVSDVPLVGGLTKLITDPAASSFRNRLNDDEKSYLDAANNFIASKLRKESGATIGAAEFDREYNRYFPQVGDSPTIIERKRLLRNAEIKARRYETGNTDQPIYGEKGYINKTSTPAVRPEEEEEKEKKKSPWRFTD